MKNIKENNNINNGDGGSGQTDGPVTSYFVSQKGQFCVLSFSGEISYRSEKVIDMAIEEIILSPAEYYVICLGKVTKFDNKGMRFFIRLQMSIRDKDCSLRICNINKLIRKELLDEGTIRLGEIREKITDAITGFIKNKKIKKDRKV